jgi:pyrroline-5-carboxylate reductase
VPADPAVKVLLGRRITIVGAGNMGEALLRGLLRSQAVSAEHIIATVRRQERLTYLQSTYGVQVTFDNVAAVRDADVVILAVKPQILDRVLNEIAGAVRPSALVLSIAAGIPTSAIEARLPAGVRVCRAMPNTPAIVDAGATAIAPGAHAGADDLAQVRAIFEAVGSVIEVEEGLLDAVTGLSGSGPAYVFLIIEALSDAGVKVGLPRYQAQALAAQTVLGSAKLLIETGEHPGVLKDRVTSPGGTAIAGLHTLEEGGLRTTLINAVVSATNRSRELGLMQKKG